ncbi:MAG: hypothetical protein HUU10_01460 [Bacteroidetes bacterium]|nr:hypothetical protein [Bacteroidota bacterium]
MVKRLLSPTALSVLILISLIAITFLVTRINTGRTQPFPESPAETSSITH